MCSAVHGSFSFAENPIVQRPKGEGMVKLSLEYVKDTFHVMVIHAKDLVSMALN